MAVCNGDVCKSIMMMNDRESTRRIFAAVKIKNLKQPLQKTTINHLSGGQAPPNNLQMKRHTKTTVRSMTNSATKLLDLQYTWLLEQFNE
jgi:hypothetical protein